MSRWRSARAASLERRIVGRESDRARVAKARARAGRSAASLPSTRCRWNRDGLRRAECVRRAPSRWRRAPYLVPLRPPEARAERRTIPIAFTEYHSIPYHLPPTTYHLPPTTHHLRVPRDEPPQARNNARLVPALPRVQERA